MTTKLLLIATFFNGLLWAVLIPIWQYPDEQAHFSQVQNIAELGYVPKHLNTSKEIHLTELVLNTARNTQGNNKYTYNSKFNIKYSQNKQGFFEETLVNLPNADRTNMIKTESTQNPPLYYTLGATFYSVAHPFGIFTRILAVRMLSLILFIATVSVAIIFAKVILPSNLFFTVALPALVAFQPMFVFSSTGVLPDALTNLLFSIVILLSTLIYKKGLSLTRIFICVLVLILGYNTRQQFPISMGFLASALLLRTYNNFGSVRPLKKVIVLIITLVILVTLVMFINAPETGSIKSYLGTDKPFGNYLSHSLVTTYSQTWPWYIGVYRWLSLSLPSATYQVINRAVIISAAGLTLLVFRHLILKIKSNLFKDTIFFFTISLIYFLILTVWDVMHRLQFGFPFGIQGRYFFPTILTNTALFIFGIYFLIKIMIGKYEKHLLVLITVLVLIFNNFSLFLVVKSYYSTSSIFTFINQASQYKADIIKGDALLGIIILAVFSQIMYAVQVCKLKFTNSHESA